jgi:hypothetical protein
VANYIKENIIFLNFVNVRVKISKITMSMGNAQGAFKLKVQVFKFSMLHFLLNLRMAKKVCVTLHWAGKAYHGQTL